MADAYGMLTFTKSEDCVFDPEKLIPILNKQNWDNYGSQWIYSQESNLFYISESNPQYPTVFPTNASFVHVEDDAGEIKRIAAINATLEDYQNAWDTEVEEMTLSELANEIASALESGWIEIACTANEKARYVYFESLRIHADGTAQRKRMRSGPAAEIIDFSEEI